MCTPVDISLLLGENATPTKDGTRGKATLSV